MSDIRVALVDDHPVVLAGIRALLQETRDIRVVGEATTGEAAMQMVRDECPDIAIIDISLPDLNGVELARHLRLAYPDVQILALTVHEDASYAEVLLQLGARGYVLKRSASEELLEAVRTVARGERYVDPVIEAKISATGGGPGGPSGTGDLSPREREVVCLTAQGYSNKEIAGLINVGVKSVETYKARAAEKLGLRTRSEIVRYARLKGWLSQPGNN